MYQFTSESVSSKDNLDKLWSICSSNASTNGNITQSGCRNYSPTNKVVLVHEYKSDRGANKDRIANLVRDVIEEIGYEQEGLI